jgi:hypothetical protein
MYRGLLLPKNDYTKKIAYSKECFLVSSSVGAFYWKRIAYSKDWFVGDSSSIVAATGALQRGPSSR